MRFLDEDRVVVRGEDRQVDLFGVLALRVCCEKRLCIPGGHFKVARKGPGRSARLWFVAVLEKIMIIKPGVPG